MLHYCYEHAMTWPRSTALHATLSRGFRLMLHKSCDGMRKGPLSRHNMDNVQWMLCFMHISQGPYITGLAGS